MTAYDRVETGDADTARSESLGRNAHVVPEQALKPVL